MNTDLHLKIDNQNLSLKNSEVSVKKVSNKELQNYSVNSSALEQVENRETQKSGDHYKIQLKDLLGKRESIEGTSKPSELAMFAKNFNYLLQKKMNFEKDLVRKKQSFNFRLSKDIFVRDIEKMIKVVQIEANASDPRLETLKNLKNSVLLELNEEIVDEEENLEGKGFCEDQINDQCYMPSLENLPIAGIFDESVNLDKIFQDYEKQVKLGKCFTKSKKLLIENITSKEKDNQTGTKNKKTDFQIILTARISKFDVKEPMVLKENAHKSYLDITEHSKNNVEKKSSSLQVNQINASQLFKLKFAEISNNCIKIQKFFNKSENEQNLKKLAYLSSKVMKKGTVKVKKGGKDYLNRSKKMFKEVLNFWKKKSKELIELKKKKEKLERELKK